LFFLFAGMLYRRVRWQKSPVCSKNHAWS